ncbi:MAG: class IV adenylate cyclase [Cyanobacteria bacterium REEB65]|nr:class IV adenylate cyclase [Cyanobacteria bacterium REEB65]
MKNAPEVEAKFRLRPGQRGLLLEHLGSPARILQQRDEYFEVPGRVLRVRFENDQPLLTRKDAAQFTSDGIKTRHEVEHPIPPDFVSPLEDLLEWLGHRRLLVVEKERREFDLPGFVVCLDAIQGLEPPDFVEIESAGGDAAALRRLRDELGLAPEQVEPRSYAALLAQESAP